MPAQKGKDLLLKLDQTGAGTYVTVAGLRASTLAFNAETVDITHQESAGRWRELLGGAGVKSASLRGNGIFKDAASDALIRQYVFDGVIRNWQAIIPDFGVVQGPFQIASYEFAGRHDGEVTFDLALASAGELTFTVL
jgi:TP901-1 family phage major tail protein